MGKAHRTQVAIIGAGPAGLVLARLLQLEGIDSIVLERQTRRHVETRVRAGVLEQGTADLLNESGVGERMRREALVHHGIELRFDGCGHRIDMYALTGRSVYVYAQHEVVKDLIAARLKDGGEIFFEVEKVEIHNTVSDTPHVTFRHGGEVHEIACDFIGGCDGFHGICLPSIPAGVLATYEKDYPFGWLGILAEAVPASHELIYANHDRGFALLSMRTPQISRAYLQCRPDEDIAGWPDDRIWDELQRRFTTQDGFQLNFGPIIQKNVTAMRSFVADPMQYGRLFLAGDAAHIVPPTGAKGLNLAIADVRVLAGGITRWYRRATMDFLERYSEICLRRVWRVQHFSRWMTYILHRSEESDGFNHRRQLAELDQVTSSGAAARTFAENYTGLPFDIPGDLS